MKFLLSSLALLAIASGAPTEAPAAEVFTIKPIVANPVPTGVVDTAENETGEATAAAKEISAPAHYQAQYRVVTIKPIVANTFPTGVVDTAEHETGAFTVPTRVVATAHGETGEWTAAAEEISAPAQGIAEAIVKSILTKHNASEEAIAEFFESHIDVVPFTPQSFEAYTNWTTKWKIDIPEFEALSNAAMEQRTDREVARRAALVYARLGQQIEYLEELARTGEMSAETNAKVEEFLANATDLERKIIEAVSEELRQQIQEEWGVEEHEGAKEPEADSVESEQTEGDDEKEGEDVISVDGEEETVETTTSGGEEEEEKEEKGDEEEGDKVEEKEDDKEEGKGDEEEREGENESEKEEEQEEVKGDEQEGDKVVEKDYDEEAEVKATTEKSE